MRPGKQNGGPTLFLPRTRSPEALPLRPPLRESMRAGAILGSQFQKGEPAATKEARWTRLLPRGFGDLGFGIWDLGFPQAACPATGARKDRARKMGRTTRSCIAR